MTLLGPNSVQKRPKISKTKMESNFQKVEKSKNVNPKINQKYKSEILVKIANKKFPESHSTLGK